MNGQVIFIAVVLCSTVPTMARDLVIPDPNITPGVMLPISKMVVCNTKWGLDKRHVTAKMKREVFILYGLSGRDDKSCRLDSHGRRWEIDHLEPRQLGGADVLPNIWPQCYSGRWNANMKDRLENLLHRKVCAGEISLKMAQKEFVGDWRIAHRKYFGVSK